MSLKLKEGVENVPRRVRQDADLSEEGCRNYMEALQDLPDPTRPDVQYLKKKLDAAVARLQEKAIPKLNQAIKDFPGDPAAWRWHWSIASVQGSGSGDKEKARESLNRALELEKQSSKRASPEEKRRLDRLPDMSRRRPCPRLVGPDSPTRVTQQRIAASREIPRGREIML